MLKKALIGLTLTAAIASVGMLIAAGPHDEHPGAGQPTQGHSQSTQADMPRIIAVKFHADWCGGCKKLSPMLQDMKATAGNSGTLYVKLDVTDDNMRKQSEYMAAALGLGDVWEQMGKGKKTGFVALYDTQRHAVVGRLTSRHTRAQADEIIKQALAGS